MRIRAADDSSRRTVRWKLIGRYPISSVDAAAAQKSVLQYAASKQAIVAGERRDEQRPTHTGVCSVGLAQ